jgi:hypothetical protein
MKSSFRPPAISTQAAQQSSLVESERLSQLGQSSISFLSSGTKVLEDHPSRSMAVLVLVASAIFLYLQLFALPAIPRVATGDQSIYLNSAARIYEGQLIYRDYDQFTFPATDVLYLGLFKLFGVRAWIPQFMLLLVGVLSLWLSIVIAGTVLRGPAVFLPGALFLVLPYSSYLDATHHLYNVFAAMVALAIVIRRRTLFRITIAGVFWGIATCFAQSLVLGQLCFSLFLVWEQRQKYNNWKKVFRTQAFAWGSYAAILLAVNGYFVWKAGVRKFGYYTGFFILKYFPTYRIGGWSTYLRGWPSPHKWTNWPDLAAFPLIHGLVPLIYVVFFILFWRRIRVESNEYWNRLVLINVTGLSLFLTVASAPSWNRLYTISMPALVMLVWFVSSSTAVHLSLRRLLCGSVLALAIARPLVDQIRWRAVLDLPTGSTVFFDSGLYEETKWVQERTLPGDYFFGDQLICFDLRLKNPGRVAYVTPFAFTTAEEIADLVQSLDTHKVELVSWYPGLDDPRAIEGNHLEPLRRYLAEHYRIAQRFTNGHLIWQRNAATE